MKILFTFPGQGTQHAGMLQNLPGTELALAREVLGAETNTLDTPDALQHTRAVQLALLIAGVAWARELERRGVAPDIVSGLSIGAYPAAVIAGALEFTDALTLVALRGDLMEQAYPRSRLRAKTMAMSCCIWYGCDNFSNCTEFSYIFFMRPGIRVKPTPACTRLSIEKMSFTRVTISGSNPAI
ncbi:Malonyl CoA-acyl carrier protein transacylase [Citrobacter koseri]|nr:Malonyl CoA-acyl carrier protein transacylase [Citrobacter koseri]CAH5950674.1 Malonyl CoA-acyl carrier protein transacylase [Citrobacter koseri]